MASDPEKRAKDAFMDDHFEDAVNLFSEAIDMDPDNANLFADRALAHIKLQNFTEALADADRAIQLDDSMSKAHVRKGIALTKLAEASIETGFNLAPDRNAKLYSLMEKCNQLTAASSSAMEMEIDDGNGDLHEQVYLKLKVLKDRYEYRMLDLLQQTCRRLEQAIGKHHWLLLRKYIIKIIVFLNMEKGTIPLCLNEKMKTYEENILEFLTTHVRVYNLI